MVKVSTTFRLEEQQLQELMELVELYKQKQENNELNSDFNVRISRASIVEMLIRQQYIKEFIETKQDI